MVYAYDFNIESGTISNRRVFIEFPKEYGLPDGMTVDSEGRLWIAHWGGGRVSCWDPVKGTELERIELPARLVTSCTFGGPQMDDLYITTAMGEKSGQEDRYGGSLFRIKTGASGIPATLYQGTT
ncbi:MAG: SMP-30/gluconolactonase/LRE family protein [Bacillota bacterium]